MKRFLAASLITASMSLASAASADTFEQGSLIIPMDTTYQDSGMLKAYGLVYKLLHSNVPVRWVILPGKTTGQADFTASASDHQSNATITAHGYRGGPFVIDSADAPAAIPIINAWQAAYPAVKVHQASAAFTATVARYLVVAPRVAMHADGSQNIAVSYLNAAGIPDSQGNPWPSTSPDLLTPAAVAGPTTTNHHDGALFDSEGNPLYCQFMSMHWAVTSAQANPEVVAETREFLHNQVHFFAECQAVDAFENLVPYGHFLTPNGFLVKAQPTAVDFFHADQTFNQIDGAFGTTGGSEPAYALPAGDTYKSNADITLITNHASPPGTWDVWMTGYLDGACAPFLDSCGTLGKVSYLGGHQYTVNVPISANPKTQGVRLFLNSLFDSYCAASNGLPQIDLEKIAPDTTTTATVTYTLYYSNSGPSVALNAVLSDGIPAGSSFVSATDNGTFSGGKVTWNLGNLGVGNSGSVAFTVTLGGFGTYANTAQLGYVVGLNSLTKSSNTTSTLYAADTDNDGVLDPVDICPNDYDPSQDLTSDPSNCGSCGHVCTSASGTPICISGACVSCNPADPSLATDPNNCGACGHVCSFANATASCAAGSCVMGACLAGFVDADGSAANGCEYACVKTAANDATCDGIDDDCDGQIDEDYAPTSCGIGACAALSTCTLGAASCTTGVPSIEGPEGSATCSDGVDNDCDGLTDAADSDCQSPPCQSATDCDDGNPCTQDTCSSGFCSHAGIACGGGGGGAGGAGTSSGAGGAATSSSTTGGSTGGSTTSSSTSGGLGGSSGGASIGGSMGGAATGTPSTTGSSSGADSGDQGSCACRAAPARGSAHSLEWLVAAVALALGRRRLRRVAPRHPRGPERVRRRRLHGRCGRSSGGARRVLAPRLPSSKAPSP